MNFYCHKDIVFLLPLPTMTESFSQTLPENECFHVIETYTTNFKLSFHRHDYFEMHFIENGKGLMRIVGDSMEYIENYDLIIIKGNKLDHGWDNGKCANGMIREIVVFFSEKLLSSEILQTDEFITIEKMFKQAEQGISFPISAIMKVYSQIDNLPSAENHFKQYLSLLNLLHDLSICEGIRTLASTSFTKFEKREDNPKIFNVKRYVNDNYNTTLSLNVLSDLVDMTPVAFSRFFKQQTGKNISEYIIEVRLGYASRLLLDSSLSVSEICTQSGFNNLSNFNRFFKKKKGVTPKEFRSNYRKNKY